MRLRKTIQIHEKEMIQFKFFNCKKGTNLSFLDYLVINTSNVIIGFTKAGCWGPSNDHFEFFSANSFPFKTENDM